MQKKINMFIIGYIFLICVVGVFFFVKQQIDSIPVVDDDLIQELLESAKATEQGSGEVLEPEPSQELDEKNVDSEGAGNNYWQNYNQETEQGKDSMNPVVSQIQKQITTVDKLKIMNIIKKNLSSEDIKYIISLSKNGFTSDEQAKVKSILQEKVGEEEKKELKSLILKYL